MGYQSAGGGGLDIIGLTEESTINDSDLVVIYDVSEGANRSMTRANFVAGITGAGESNTASNQGTASDGTVFLQKSGVDLQFRGLESGNSILTIANNVGTNNVDFTVNVGNINHGGISGLADDDHTQYALLAGRSGGQILTGGTDAGDNLSLVSTTNGTKGDITFNSLSLNSGSRYDETNDRFSVGGSENEITISTATVGSRFTVHAEGAVDLADVTFERHSDNAAFGTQTIYGRARGTHTTPSIVQDGDSISRLISVGYDGSDFGQVAEMRVEIDGSPGAGDMPGRFVWLVSADGTEVPAEGMRLNASGLTVANTVNGRDIAADGTKLDGIATGATANQADAFLLNRANHTGSQAIGTVTGLQTALDSKLNLSGGVLTGALTTTSTIDGRDIATDGTKLDGIDAGADVTDSTNVQAAGAVMDSELTNESAVKAINQGLATTDNVTFEEVVVLDTTGNADVFIQGALSSILNMVDTGAGSDLKRFRITNDEGFLTFQSRNDNNTAKANFISLDSSTGNTIISGTLEATLSTAAQPNITSVGTLTGLTTSGTVNINGAAASRDLNLKGFMNLEASANTNAWAIYTNSDNSFRMNYNGAGGDEFVIDSSGNVTATSFTGTILTAAQPNITSVGNLAVAQGATGTSFIEVGQGRTVDGVSFIDLVGDTTFTDYGLRVSRNSGASGGGLITSRGDGVLNIQTEGAGSLALNTNGNSGLIVDGSTQNVSIPNGSLSISDGGAAPVGGTGINFGDADGDGNYKWIQSYDSHPLVLNPVGNNVGIGITSADSLLHVNGSFRQTGASVPFEWTVNAGAEDFLKLNAVGFADNLLVANSAGNVSVGIGAPETRLHASGGDANGWTSFTDNVNNNSRLKIGSRSANLSAIQSVRIDTDANTDLTLQPLGGNIGVGTTSPDAKLHVSNGSAGAFTPGASFDEVVIENSGSSGITIVSPDADVASIAFSNPSLTNDVGALFRWQYGTGGATQKMIIGTNSASGSISLHTGSFVEAVNIASDGGVFANNLKSGTSQANAGAAANELWIDTADNSIKIGV